MILKRKELFLLLVVVVIVQLSLCSAVPITSYVDKPASLLDNVSKMYEISQTSQDQGYSASLGEMDAILLKVANQDYYFFVVNISENSIDLVTLEGNHFILNLNETRIIDFTDSASGNVDYIGFTLVSSNNNVAEVLVKTYEEKTKPAIGYKELFDINIKLNKDKVFSMSELTAYITFTNFGEGPSNVKITYIIKDESGKEVYRGIDEKVVYTEDSVAKTFDFINLPLGNYLFSAKIDYGTNQTASSEINFSIIKEGNLSGIITLVIFFAVLIGMFIILRVLKKRSLVKEKSKS